MLHLFKDVTWDVAKKTMFQVNAAFYILFFFKKVQLETLLKDVTWDVAKETMFQVNAGFFFIYFFFEKVQLENRFKDVTWDVRGQGNYVSGKSL